MNFLSHLLRPDFGGAISEDWARNSRRSGSCIRADLSSRAVVDNDTASPLYPTLTPAQLRMQLFGGHLDAVFGKGVFIPFRKVARRD